jgi:hypothetical protein
LNPHLRHRFAALCTVLLVAPATTAGAQTNPFAPAPQAVATQFADGRTTYNLLKPGGASSWTPAFPRVAGENTDRNGLPLAALDVAVVNDGQKTSVSVSLIYGRPHQHKIAVATVTITPDTPVRVHQLREYGVWPITVSLVPAPPALAIFPRVTSTSLSLDARVELAPGGGQTFMVVVVNQSSQALRGFRIVADRQGRRALSAYRRAPRHAVLIQPGDGFTVELPASLRQGVDGGPTTAPVDLVSITSVTWDDGTVEGEQEPAAIEHVVAKGSSRQLSRVLDVLRATGAVVRPQALSELRERIAALSIEVSRADAAVVHAALPHSVVMPIDRVESYLKTGMQQVRQLALADLDAFLKEPVRESPMLWLSMTIAACEEWLARAERASAL